MYLDTVLTPRRVKRLPRRKPSILIIDDDDNIRETLTFCLQRQGYETLSASSGQEGLALAQSDRPGAIVLDLALPDMDGFSLCEELDGSSETCHIPIIILSGMERPDIIRRARMSGCTYFLRKPYDPNALLVLLESALHESAGEPLAMS